MKTFKEFTSVNESFLPSHLKVDEDWFEKRIKSDLINIIMEEKGVSEKSFSQVDEIMLEMKQFMEKGHPFRNKLNEMLNMQGARERRSKYWAERAYEEIYKNRLLY